MAGALHHQALSITSLCVSWSSRHCAAIISGKLKPTAAHGSASRRGARGKQDPVRAIRMLEPEGLWS